MITKKGDKSEKSDEKRVMTMVYGGLSLACASSGLKRFIEGYSKTTSIREAVYAQADKITPEVIEQADQLASNAGMDYLVGSVFFIIAGVSLGSLYYTRYS